MSVIDAHLDTILEGFDIDGVLTEEENRELFLEAANTKKVIPIIITGRSENGLQTFLNNHSNIAEASEREFASTIKIFAFRDAKDQWPYADQYVYHGSGFRDRVLSNITGWNYSQK